MNVEIEIPREAIAEMVRELFAELSPGPVPSTEAEEMRTMIARIMAKKLITINELRVLFGECSHGYVGKLIAAAQEPNAEHPIPYCDLNGLIMFEPELVMAWARERKPLRLKQKRSGGRKQHHLREVKAVSR